MTRMITADGLSKSYGTTRVVHEVSFVCRPGTVTGLVGPDGAGKSTTIRMLTGLTRPDRGSAMVAGRPFAELPNPMRTVGTMLDATAMHPGRSGRATLRLAARTGGLPAKRADEILDRVELPGAAADRRVGSYSPEMRQRLGLALALIGEPHVLILDEPTNGLDRLGVAWMGRLLGDFSDRAGTVLLSGHDLSEMQATIDHLVVIEAGRVVARRPTEPS